MRKLCEKLTKGNICVGQFIEKWYGTKADYISYGAVEEHIEQFNQKDSKNILFIGRLEKDTGILEYIDALKLFKANNNTDFIFQICGDGLLKEQVLSFLEENKITFEFYGFKKDVYPFIQSSRVVFTSSYLSIMETISFGKPLIASYNNPLKKDYLEIFPNQKKLFLCAKDPIQITNYLKDLFTNPDKFDNQHTYRQDFIKDFTWSKTAEMYLSLYQM
jgi:glycosyltransferase involved in cell wall biosynthesis